MQPCCILDCFSNWKVKGRGYTSWPRATPSSVLRSYFKWCSALWIKPRCPACKACSLLSVLSLPSPSNFATHTIRLHFSFNTTLLFPYILPSLLAICVFILGMVTNTLKKGKRMGVRIWGPGVTEQLVETQFPYWWNKKSVCFMVRLIRML